MLIAHDILIMAVDGARMSLFRNHGTDREPKLELLAEKENKASSAAELGDERPGRVYQSSGQGSGAYEATDLHQKQEDEFVLEMAELFNFHMANSERRAILIAPPKVLGIMRTHLLDEVRTQIVAEIAKDYCGQSALELTKLLSDYDPNK